MDRSLRRAVLERLAAVEEMAARTGSHLSVRVARTHLKTITGGWRELLLEHQPDLKGRCPVCSGWLRRRRWPCQVWVTAHRHLIGGDGPEPGPKPTRKTTTFRCPRQVEIIPRQTAAAGSADQIRTEQIRAEHTRGNEGRGAGGGGTGGRGVSSRTEAAVDPGTTEYSPGGQSAFVIRQRSADTGDIHRAASTDREPTMPPSRRTWRSRY